jgi:hypothetical protein
MNCFQCQTTNPPGSKFCSNCGNNLSAATPVVASVPAGGSKRIRIGREVDNDVRIPPQYGQVGRYQAEVFVDASGGLSIEDKGSSNGTFVNNVPTGSTLTPVRMTDEVRFGSYTFDMQRLQSHLGAAAPPPSAAPRPPVGTMPQTETYAASSPWRSGILIFTGIFLIGIIFAPIDGESIFEGLSSEHAPGWAKIWLFGSLGGAVACLMAGGQGKSRKQGGQALLAVNGVLWFTLFQAYDELPRDAREMLSMMGAGDAMGRMFLTFGALIALGAFLLLWPSRRNDSFVRNGIALSAGIYLLLGWLAPMEVGYNESKVPLLALLESMGDLNGNGLLLLALRFVPFGVAVRALFLLREETPAFVIATVPTQMGQLLGSIVPITILVAVYPYMDQMGGEGVLAVGAMIGFSIVYIFGAMAGLALLGMADEQEGVY